MRLRFFVAGLVAVSSPPSSPACHFATCQSPERTEAFGGSVQRGGCQQGSYQVGQISEDSRDQVSTWARV